MLRDFLKLNFVQKRMFKVGNGCVKEDEAFGRAYARRPRVDGVIID